MRPRRWYDFRLARRCSVVVSAERTILPRSARGRTPGYVAISDRPSMVKSDELSFAEVEGLRVGYRQAGQGSALVLLHGFLCDSRCWLPQLSGLSGSFRVVAWDAPGAGASSDPPDTFTTAGYARCLARFLDLIGISRIWSTCRANRAEFYRLYPARPLSFWPIPTPAGRLLPRRSEPAGACPWTPAGHRGAGRVPAWHVLRKSAPCLWSFMARVHRLASACCPLSFANWTPRPAAQHRRAYVVASW
jgi:hypothetical protein